MARRFTGPSRGRTGSRRQSLWIAAVSSSTTITAANGATIVSSLNVAALALRPFTIVRTRGWMHVRSDQLATGEFYEATYGGIVVTDQAVTAGVASVLSPETDGGSDWFFYETLGGFFNFATSVGNQDIGQSKVFDSKAMRKVDLGEDLITVMEASSVSLGVTMVDQFRILIKLH